MVGIPVPLVKCVLRGRVDATQDWSTAFWVAGGGIDTFDPATLDSFGTAVLALMQTMVNSIKSHLWDTHTGADGGTFYYYAPNTLKAQLVSMQDFASQIVGSASGHSPRQLACVASLRSAQAGRSSRGRMYIPVTGLAPDTNGQIQDADLSATLNAVATCLSGVNALTPSTYALTQINVVVASFTKTHTTPIDAVTGNSLAMTQRRREDKLSANSYEQATVTHP